MMKKFVTVIILLTCSTLLVACGNEDDPTPTDEILDDARSNFLNGEPCGFEIISDRNSYASTCRTATGPFGDVEDLQSCRDKAQSFVDKYPGINCTASVSSDSSVDDDTITILEADIVALIVAVEADLAN